VRVIVDVNVPIAIGATAGAPHCDCGTLTTWIPQIGAIDLRSDSTSEQFPKFDTYDGRNNKVHIDSLHKLRQVERESEKMAADGVGQPMVWRRYSQDRSNQDQSALHRSLTPGEAPTPEAARRFGGPNRALANEAAAGDYGPGVTDANTSALGGGD
jgi:hypothetical protein